MSDPFKASKVITQHISESNFKTYFVGFDVDMNDGKRKYRWNELLNLLQAVIPEFAYGLHEGSSVPQEELVHRLTEAAKAIYKIDAFSEAADLTTIPDDDPRKKFLSRGEFGELILHLILRSFQDTIPLLSKIYFKDSFGTTVHGFDAVHVQPDTKTLWLGESKLYTDGAKGITALIKDLKEHITQDYLRSEFSLITKKIKGDEEIPDRDHWVDLMHQHTKLSDVLTSVTIPILCTYTSDNFTNFDDEKAQEFIQAYETEVNKLKADFEKKNDHPLKTDLNIVLMLFPVPSKDLLVSKLHQKLKLLQSIEDE